MGTRRTFLGNALAGVAVPLVSTLSTEVVPQKTTEVIMLGRAAHDIGDALSRHERVDKDLIRSWIVHSADHGVSSFFYRGAYHGIAVYHSAVLTVIKAKGSRVDFLNDIGEAIKGLDPLDISLAEAKRRKGK